MWNNIFFLYSVGVMIMSGLVNAKLADIASPSIKYLNSIVLAMSIALAAFVVGIMFGQSSYACVQKRSLDPCNVASQVALLILAIIIEGLLAAMVANGEFAALNTSDKSAHDLILAMLVLNSVGIVGGVFFVAYPNLKDVVGGGGCKAPSRRRSA